MTMCPTGIDMGEIKGNLEAMESAKGTHKVSWEWRIADTIEAGPERVFNHMSVLSRGPVRVSGSGSD
jgi:hypothetical protein